MGYECRRSSMRFETRGSEKIGCRPEILDSITQRRHEPPRGRAKELVIVNDRDEWRFRHTASGSSPEQILSRPLSSSITYERIVIPWPRTGLKSDKGQFRTRMRNTVRWHEGLLCHTCPKSRAGKQQGRRTTSEQFGKNLPFTRIGCCRDAPRCNRLSWLGADQPRSSHAYRGRLTALF